MTKIDEIIDSFCEIKHNLNGKIFYRLDLRTNKEVENFKKALNNHIKEK